MSDRLAVIDRGRVEQVGTPPDVYERPATEFVAGFIGLSNLIDREGERLTIRPEKVHLLMDAGDLAPARAHVENGVVAEVVYLGPVTRYVVDLDGGGRLAALRQNLETAAADVLETRGRRVRVAWMPDHAYRIGSADTETAKRTEDLTHT